ncbi:MAG: universal stress protein [Hyphomicrobiaceae bacterium]
MIVQQSAAVFAKKLLLATDVRPACDRALDRAVQLAQMWRSHLTVLHVIETARIARSGGSRKASMKKRPSRAAKRWCAASLISTPSANAIPATRLPAPTVRRARMRHCSWAAISDRPRPRRSCSGRTAAEACARCACGSNQMVRTVPCAFR